MPGIEISKENLRREEKRNLILKLRFGTYETHELKPTSSKLLVNGQAVKQKQRSKKIKKLPDYGKVKLFVSKKKGENGFGDLLSTKSAFQTKNFARNANELEEHYNRDGGKYNEDVYMGIQISRNGVLEAVEELQEYQNYDDLPKIVSGFSSGNFTKSGKASQQLFGSYDEKYGGNIKSENAPPNSFTRRISSVSGHTSISGKSSRKTSLVGRNTKRWNETSNKGKKSRKGSKQDSCEMEEKLLYHFHEDFNDDRNETIFFDYPGIHLSFVDVQEAIEQIIPNAFEANKVTSIQFENLSYKFGSQRKPNRWHLKLHDAIIKKKLLETGIKLQSPKMRETETTKNEI